VCIRHVFLHFITKMGNEQEQWHMDVCSTGDEMWTFNYDPESK
jgi:hypothetical protein